MSRKSLISQVACLSLALVLMGLMGCENGNLFGKLHDSGDSRDINVLQSDAQIALEHKDFAGALSLYERILAQSPDNSNALNGAAIAAVAGAGLNFGQILANISKQGAAPSIDGLGDLVSAARSGFSTQNVSASSILAGVDLPTLDACLDLAICRLTRIVSGLGDGVIKTDDPAILIDLACLRLIRGTLRPIRAGFFDVEKVGGTYKLVLLTDANTICGNSANDPLVIASAKDLVAGYVLFSKSVQVLGAATNSIVARLQTQMDECVVAGLTPGNANALPSACITTINTAGITSTNFRTNTEAFSPQSGC